MKPARALMALGMAILAAGCGREDPGSATGASAGSATPLDESRVPGLPEMVFRPSERGDGLLAAVFRHPQAGYSIRPPSGWTRSNAGSAAASPLTDRATFRNPATGDFLDLGIAKGGPTSLTPASLIALKDTLAQGIRASGQAELIGTDVFRFARLDAVQLLVNREGTIILHILAFRKPGEFLQVVWGIHQSRYRGLARSVEASLASLKWSRP